jgi:hypothetical protein
VNYGDYDVREVRVAISGMTGDGGPSKRRVDPLENGRGESTKTVRSAPSVGGQAKQGMTSV